MVKKLYVIILQFGWKKLALLSFGTVILSASETLSIGIIIPIIGLFANPDKIHSSSLKWLYEFSGHMETSALLILMILAAIALFMAKTAYSLFMLYQQQNYLGFLDNSIKTAVLEGYLKKPYSFHIENNSSILFRNMTSEVGQFINGFMTPVITIISEGMIITGIFMLLLFVYPLITISLLAFIGIILTSVTFLTKRKIKSYAEARVRYSEKIFKYALEALNAIKEVTVYNVKDLFINRFASVCEKYTNGVVKFNMVSSLPRHILELMVFCSILGTLLFSRWKEINILEMMPVMVVIGVAALRVLPSVNKIHSSLNYLNFSANSLDVICEALQNEIPDRAGAGRNVDLSVNGKEDLSIKLEDISFSYGSISAPIFENVSVTIPLYKTVAFAGVSGAGKSTLIDVLMGLLTPHKGTLRYCGTAIDENNILAYRRRIGYVPQHIYLIDDTIEANIAFGIFEDNIDRSRLEYSVDVAMLSEFVKDLQGGLKTQIGERGIKLSGGQRQRIGIARALYNNPEILILDEATSALDGFTEAAINSAIKRLKGDITIIIVAHRLSTIEDADIIYVMEGGQIVAQGVFSDLIGRSPSFQKIADQMYSLGKKCNKV